MIYIYMCTMTLHGLTSLLRLTYICSTPPTSNITYITLTYIRSSPSPYMLLPLHTACTTDCYLPSPQNATPTSEAVHKTQHLQRNTSTTKRNTYRYI